MFELFDPDADFRVSQGCQLPHWYQPGVTYFITFRTEDSIPSDVARLWHRRRDDWLRRRGVEPKSSHWRAALNRLPLAARREFHRTFSRQYLEFLDRGCGACMLRRRELASIVSDSMLHFDGQRYHMGSFVVMPNHVHALCCLLGDVEIEQQCESWKHFTARKINRQIGTRGRFWQEDSFDHLVRSEQQYQAIQQYIATNPEKAGLSPNEYLLYHRR